MPEPTWAPLKKLWRLSVSEDVYDLIVAPLAEALFGEKPTHQQVKNIEGTLTELHKCLWRSGAVENKFPGAVAGRFEELMLPLRKAMKGGCDGVKVGAEKQKITKEERKEGATDWSLGGDVTVYKTGGPTLTYQLKVAGGASPMSIMEHISKAGAQLSGETGEYPEDGSTRVIYILVQDTNAFDAFTIDRWKTIVEDALARDYVSDHGKGNKPARTVKSDTIKQSVDVVKIFTSTKRFKYPVIAGVVQAGGEKGASSSNYLAYANGKLEAHWNWLLNWFKERAAEKGADWAEIVRLTKEFGVKGNPGAWQALPRESQAKITL